MPSSVCRVLAMSGDPSLGVNFGNPRKDLGSKSANHPGRIGLWVVHAYWLPAGESDFECGSFGNDRVEHRIAVEFAQVFLVTPMHKQATVGTNDQMPEQAERCIQQQCLFDGLMDRAQSLRGEILGWNWNHDEVRREQRIPAALVEVRRTVDEHEIETGNAFERPRQSELLHAEKVPVAECCAGQVAHWLEQG